MRYKTGHVLIAVCQNGIVYHKSVVKKFITFRGMACLYIHTLIYIPVNVKHDILFPSPLQQQWPHKQTHEHRLIKCTLCTFAPKFSR